MSGKSYLLDTNAVIFLLQQEKSDLLNRLKEARWIGLSVISQLEFLSFSKIATVDVKAFKEFTRRVYILGVKPEDQALIDKIIAIRKIYKIKLPDAIIASTAIINNAILITADKQFLNIKELNIHLLK